MADFSLTTLFVVPVGNVLPTSGSTENLVAGKFGIYLNDYSVANTGNVAGVPYIYLAQGQTVTLNQGSKRSDAIAASKVKSWYKTVGQSTVSLETQSLSAFSAKCDEDVSVTFRIHSSYADTISFNGLTRSVTVKMPCCGCGADPCDVIANETIIDLILAKINQEASLPLDPAAIKLTTFLSFQKVGTGDSAVLLVTAKPLTKYGNPCDIAAFPYEYDRLWFRAFAYKGPETTVDFLVYDKCEPVATVTVLQRSNFPSGTSDEIAQLQKDYYSYQAYVKHLFRMAGYNQWYDDFVTAGTIYDLYYITFDDAAKFGNSDVWASFVKQDQRVIVAAPQSVSAGIEAILVAYLGAVENKSGTNPTTTTTTSSTTSTTTTSTTTLIP